MENNKDIEKIKDDELAKEFGGTNFRLHFFNTAAEIIYIFKPRDKVYLKENFFSKTVYCEIVRCEPFDDPQYHCFVDSYVVRGLNGSKLYTRVLRDDIVNQAV